MSLMAEEEGASNVHVVIDARMEEGLELNRSISNCMRDVTSMGEACKRLKS